MWIFTRYGFYSIACAHGSSGALDPEVVMVRARHATHLIRLQKRFPVLAQVEILNLPNRDYRYRLVIPKHVWAGIVNEIVAEQEWSNFKNEVTRSQGPEGSDYVSALHEVWGVMHGFQAQAESVGKQRSQRSSRKSSE